jgi:hypothetical protein
MLAAPACSANKLAVTPESSIDKDTDNNDDDDDASQFLR